MPRLRFWFNPGRLGKVGLKLRAVFAMNQIVVLDSARGAECTVPMNYGVSSSAWLKVRSQL